MGDGQHYQLLSYDNAASLTNAHSILLAFAPGFVDIGAYEFHGSSIDTIPPTITATAPSAVQSGGMTLPVSQITLTFSEPVNAVDANAATDYQLIGAGPDGQFGTLDDITVALTPQYVPGSTQVALNIGGGNLTPGLYRLTIPSSASGGIHDLSGNLLDGDANGTPGGDYVRTFTVMASTGSISGRVYNDANNSGTLDAGETGLAGWTVYLDANNNGMMDAGETSVLTDATGAYNFAGLQPGSYVVREVVQVGYARTAPLASGTTVNLAGGQSASGPVFGDVLISSVTMNFSYVLKLIQNYNHPGTFATGDLNGDGTVNFSDVLLLIQNYGHALRPPAGSISGQLFNDANNSGTLEAGEGGLSGWTVYLDANNNGTLDPGETSTTTTGAGAYSFSGLTPGSYVVRQVVPAGYARTAPLAAATTVNVVSGQTAAGPLFGDVLINSVTLNFNYVLKLIQNYNHAGTFASGDLNGDSTVNFSDVLLLVQHYGHPLSSTAAAVALDPVAADALAPLDSSSLLDQLGRRRNAAKRPLS